MKPSRRRIVVYGVCIVAAMVVPVAGALVLGFLGPSPYLLDEGALGPEWSSPRRFPDGSTVSVTDYPSPAAASQGAESISQSIPTSSASRTLDVAWRGPRRHRPPECAAYVFLRSAPRGGIVERQLA